MRLKLVLWGMCSLGPALFGQTDETIFREFQFDFSTPGARANAMGRAFVGLSDEATAAYNNPAGLSVLQKPEFSFEYRDAHSRYEALQNRGKFALLNGSTESATTDLAGLTFSSVAVSRGKYNLSAFFVNHLDYRRPVTRENNLWEHDDDDNFYTFNYVNDHEVKRIVLDTYGLSLSRNFGSWSLGVSVGFSRLEIDYRYLTILSALDIENFRVFDRVDSEATHSSSKPTFVLGWLYQVHPKVKLALSAKRQPRFSYTELVANNENTDPTLVPVQFKIPDSYQFGMAYQPDDFWTVVLELNFVQYRQLGGEYFTILSAIETPEEDFFRFEREDFTNGNDPSVHVGTEYLLPRGKYIFAFRTGVFFERDHKTRFVGRPVGEENPVLFDLQDFIYKTGSQNTAVGTTLGIGLVRNNRMQLDLALVNSDRFRWMVTSFLYRF